jgi:hypothetical protein
MVHSPLHYHCGYNKDIKPYKSISKTDEACRQHDMRYQAELNQGKDPYNTPFAISLPDQLFSRQLGKNHPYVNALKYYKMLKGRFIRQKSSKFKQVGMPGYSSLMDYEDELKSNKRSREYDPNFKTKRYRIGFTPKKDFLDYVQPKTRLMRTRWWGSHFTKQPRMRKYLMKRKRTYRKRKPSMKKKMYALWRRVSTGNDTPKKVYAFNSNIEYTGQTNKRTWVELGNEAGQGDGSNPRRLMHVRSLDSANMMLEAAGYTANQLATDDTRRFYFHNCKVSYNIANSGNEMVTCRIWKVVCLGGYDIATGFLEAAEAFASDADLFPNQAAEKTAVYDSTTKKLVLDDSPFFLKRILKWGFKKNWKVKCIGTFKLNPNQHKYISHKMSGPCSMASHQTFYKNAGTNPHYYLPGFTSLILDFKAVTPLHSKLTPVPASGDKNSGVPGGRIIVKARYSGCVQQSEQNQTQYFNQKIPNRYEESTYGNLQLINASLNEVDVVGN